MFFSSCPNRYVYRAFLKLFLVESLVRFSLSTPRISRTFSCPISRSLRVRFQAFPPQIFCAFLVFAMQSVVTVPYLPHTFLVRSLCVTACVIQKAYRQFPYAFPSAFQSQRSPCLLCAFSVMSIMLSRPFSLRFVLHSLMKFLVRSFIPSVSSSVHSRF